MNDTKGISIQRSSTQNINYNNLIGNTYSIELGTSQEQSQPNCNYKYYETSSTDESIVSQQILDICGVQSLGNIFYIVV